MKIRESLAMLTALSIAACSGGSGGPGSVSPVPSIGSPSANIGDSSQSPTRSVHIGYQVSELPTFGGTIGNAASINERGWAVGAADEGGDSVSHAALWIKNAGIDLGTLGGPSSAIAWPNLSESGILSGISETAAMNTYNEPWSCWQFFLPYQAPTGHVCLAFRWHDHVMTALPTLGGQDGYGAGDNGLGQIVGWAENTTPDSTCTNGQVLQFEPTMWDAANRVHQLPTLPGDPDGAATAINDRGEIVGISGICDQAVGRFTAKHVVIWKNGKVRQLFDTGGSIAWNTPQAINHRGDVTGFVNTPGSADQAGHLQPIAFLWTHDGKLTKIPPLSGDVYSFGNGINDEGDVVGISFGPGFSTARAFVYHNGTTYDLNALAQNTTSSLVAANAINNNLTIVGQAVDSSQSTVPAFIATLAGCSDIGVAASATLARPARNPIVLSVRMRQQLLRRYGFQ